MDKPPIIQILQDARTAHEAGDFNNALAFYEAFFDQSLAQDPYAFYGIRLSHCLQGWTDLALVFPGAKKRLESKRGEVLADYLQHRVAERFHDYYAISQHLGLEHEAVLEFLRLYDDNPKSAAKLVKFVWDALISYEYWKVCSELLEQPAQKLDELLSLYDEALKLRQIDSSFDTPAFEKHTVEQLFEGIEKLVVILHHADRGEEIAALERQFYQSVQSKHDAYLNRQLQSKGSFLFAVEQSSLN